MLLFLMTMPEKRNFVVQNKNTDILMLVSRYNPPLNCVKTLNDKTLYTWRDGKPSLRYSQAIEVKKEKTLIEVVINISIYLTTSSIYAIEELSLFGVTLALVAPRR